PFFMWVHLYDAHAPYAPPQEFLEKAGNAYDGEIAYVDAQVGRLLDALEAHGLTSSTVVAVTGDHGESLGEHGEATHGMLAYDATLRVPLIVSAPGSDAGVSETPLSLTELPSALLQATGAAMPAGQMCGGALLHRPGAGSQASEPCDVYSESRYPRRAGWHAITALSDSQWKLIVTSERELFDVRTDPNEQRNVASSHENIVQAMGTRLNGLASAGGADAAQVAPEAAERLRSLGYASGSNAISSDDPKAPNPAAAIASWVVFERALGDLQAGRAVVALPSLKALMTQHPAAPVFQATYAQALKEAGRTREAMVIYRAAVAKWPNDATLFHDLAVAAREAGDAAEAARAEQAALALDGTSAMAQNGLGLLHADAGRSGESAAAFEKAVAQDPTNASYWTNLGNARRALADAPRAEAAYRKALGIDEGFADAINGLGTLLVQSGRASEGVPLFERALRRDPELHEARLNLGIAYQESGQREKAAATYREVLKKTPPRFARERTAAGELLKSIK
ncbi:MAG TPA: sulfatase-like hydrolase/transferase, partial [Vicinamibacterales bacterium]|nr:sulfatase-like hydrolase/transferase [Vicinamibacterales bacterium]